MTSAPGSTAPVVVLDDDPTGTQSAARVPVLLDPDADLGAVLDAVGVPLYVLTNTRAVDRDAAATLVASLARRAVAAGAERGLRPEFVLRGDSTLRGHVFAETDALAAALGTPDAATLFVPAFPEGGRTTVDGVHRLLVDGVPVPVARTEFAADPVFGYTAETLVDWVREVGDRDAVSVPLADVRRGPWPLARALRDAPAGTVVLPDVETDDDLAAVSAALDVARAGGREVVLRCGAPLAARRAGRLATGPLDRPVAGTGRPRTLVVCGSHTAASGRQLAALTAALGVEPFVLDTAAALSDAGRAGADLAARARPGLARGVAVLASERVRRAEHGGLDHGAAVMRALCTAVALLAGDVEAVVTKGGITAADVATRGFGARRARVLGPVLPGVPVWRLDRPGGTTIVQAVVPGNVGSDDTLVEVARAVGLTGTGRDPAG